jgi:hypothetical protein
MCCFVFSVFAYNSVLCGLPSFFFAVAYLPVLCFLHVAYTTTYISFKNILQTWSRVGHLVVVSCTVAHSPRYIYSIAYLPPCALVFAFLYFIQSSSCCFMICALYVLCWLPYCLVIFQSSCCWFHDMCVPYVLYCLPSPSCCCCCGWFLPSFSSAMKGCSDLSICKQILIHRLSKLSSSSS